MGERTGQEENEQVDRAGGAKGARRTVGLLTDRLGEMEVAAEAGREPLFGRGAPVARRLVDDNDPNGNDRKW